MSFASVEAARFQKLNDLLAARNAWVCTKTLLVRNTLKLQLLFIKRVQLKKRGEDAEARKAARVVFSKILKASRLRNYAESCPPVLPRLERIRRAWPVANAECQSRQSMKWEVRQREHARAVLPFLGSHPQVDPEPRPCAPIWWKVNTSKRNLFDFGGVEATLNWMHVLIAHIDFNRIAARAEVKFANLIGTHFLFSTKVICQFWIAPQSDLVLPSMIPNKERA